MAVSEDFVFISCILVFCVFIFFLYCARRGKQKDKTSLAENAMAKSSVSYGSSLVLRDASILLAIFIFGGVLFCGYWFLFHHDPASDAKKAVQMVCDCSSASSERRLGRYKQFLSSFETYQFKSQSEARDKLQLTVAPDDDILRECLNQQNNTKTTLRTNYIADPAKLNEFDLVFGQLISTCTDPYLLQINVVKIEIDKKIATLKNPEPGETEIKHDLIGRQIENWNFTHLSEFKQFHIDSIARNGNRIEYQISMLLQNEQTQIYQGDKVLVTYEKEEQGWYLHFARALMMSYRNKALVNQWQRIGLLPNCNWGVDGHGLRFWIRDGLYGEQQMGGPDVTDSLHIYSNEVYIMSREDHDIDLDFIYYPRQ